MTTAEKTLSYQGADLFTLRAEDVGAFWPVICRFLVMVENPEWTTDQVYESIKDGKSQVWGMAVNGEIQGIWITRIEEGRDRYGLVWIAAGKGLEKGLFLFLAATEEWFRDQGCKYVKVYGRKGWAKVLPGYEVKAYELRKTL